jgi:hypothetical protein
LRIAPWGALPPHPKNNSSEILSAAIAGQSEKKDQSADMSILVFFLVSAAYINYLLLSVVIKPSRFGLAA